MKRARLLAATAVITVIFAAPAALAAGFYIKEQSVSGLGRAFAGQSAAGEDATTIYFNPAGLVRLSRGEVNVGANFLFPSDELQDRGSVFGPFLNIPTGGGDGGDPYDPSLVPNFYAAAPLMHGRLWVGFGLSSPFGLANKYNEDWFGRYDSIKSRLLTVDAAPTLAYRVNDWVGIGAGVDFQYADATLTNAVPTIASLSIGAAGDVVSRLTGDDYSVGFNIGALAAPSESWRVGLHYRSAISHTLRGDVRVESRAAATAQGIAGEADLDLPDIAALGVAYDWSPALTLFGEVNWYGWSKFEEIRVVRRDSGATLSDVDQNYQDTFSYAVGAQYDLNNGLALRVGYQFDETPTVDGFRSTRTPDGDRNWVTAGASYDLNDVVVFDAALAHIFVEDAAIEGARPFGSPGAGAGSLTLGRGESSVEIVSLGLRRRF
jgi:long-chain fatty acid transport protein